ncbi:hypothetical protein ABZV60_02145 [Streptomyces sp. NPDC004787]|uniref:hypothetical protein n=1 Tax=Streptomyces sp. NPDC004787 TaxID=3154291 RepID=UPI0033B45967
MEDLGAEPAFLLEVVVDEVGGLARLLGEQALARLALEVEEDLPAGDGPEGDQGEGGDEGDDQQGSSQ